MTRVAIDARLLAYQRAGTATYIRGLIDGFHTIRQAKDLVLLTSRRDERAYEIRQVARRKMWTPCHHRLERWTLGLELATQPVDVLHSPDFIAPARLGRRWARVITVHDLAFLRYPHLLTNDSRRYYGQIFRSTREAECIIAVSEATRQDLFDLVGVPASKVTVVSEGVDSHFAPMSESIARRQVLDRFGIDAPFFLFVGTIEPRKNLKRLVQAFAIFRQHAVSSDALLVLAGNRGWLSDELDEVVRPLGDSVRMIGRVSEEDLIHLYNATLAVVLVSLYEGFGLPVVEAMACARPVLVSNRAALPDVVGDAGLLVEAEDVNAIALGFERLWEDESLRRVLGERGRQRAQSFDWATAAQRTGEVYRKAAACVS